MRASVALVAAGSLAVTAGCAPEPKAAALAVNDKGSDPGLYSSPSSPNFK